MATFLTEEENKQNNSDSTMNQVNGLSGNTFSANSAPSQPASPVNQPKGSGRFTNIQQYLGANQGAGKQLTQGIERKGESFASDVRQGIQQAQGVQQGIRSEQNRIGQAGQLANRIQNDAVGVARDNLQDVTQLRLGQNQAGRLQGQGFEARAGLMQSIDPLQQFGQNLGSESGRFQVLQNTFGGQFKPDYSMGQRRLDQLFLQSSPDANLGQLQQNLGNVASEGKRVLNELQGGLDSGIQGIRTGAQEAQNQILGAIGEFSPDQRGAFGQLYSDFGSEQQVKQKERQAQIDRLRSAFGEGFLTNEQAKTLGIKGPIRVSDMDLARYGKENILTDQATMQDVLDRRDLEARLNALSQLAGTDSQQYDLGQKTRDVVFDQKKFTKDAAKEVKGFEDRFFDKNFFDYYSDDSSHLFKDRNNSIEDMIKVLAGQKSIDGGFLRPVYGLNLGSDTSSREQLANVADALTRTPRAGSLTSWTEWRKLLSIFDELNNRQLNVGQNPKGGKYPSKDGTKIYT